MIKYKNSITIQHRRNGDIDILSDKGDLYKTFSNTYSKNPITDWWGDQHKSELREWQKDIVLGYAVDALGQGTTFLINKKGQGYSQAHDMALFYIPKHKCWIFSTQEDYWIQFSDGGEVIFERKDSLGSLLNKEDRLTIGQIWDMLKQQHNPENINHVIR
jgi:hypothetical protein